jgi:protein ImuA
VGGEQELQQGLGEGAEGRAWHGRLRGWWRAAGSMRGVDASRIREQNKNMSPPSIEALRGRIRLLERPVARAGGVLPFGVAEVDAWLPEGGLALGALHEVAGGGADGVMAAAATLFVAGVLARLERPVLWCAVARDLFAPGLAGVGLAPGRLMQAVAPDEKHVLLAMEEALRHPGLAAVVGELSRLPMVASRRLVLAAEKSGVMAVVVRRRREGKVAEGGLSAAATRWYVTPVPSVPGPSLSGFGMGRARWRVELVRCRGGEAAEWVMEACDAQGCLGVSAAVANRQAA